MSDQLEVEAVTTKVVAPLTEDNADTVAAGEETHEKPTFSPEQHAAAANAFKAREAKRETEELRKQLEELKRPAQSQAPVVPVLPEYAEPEEVAEYTRQVQAAATYKAQQDFNEQQQQNTAQQAQLAEGQRQENQRLAFLDNSKKQGINAEDLQTAASLVDSYGLNNDITQALLDDKDGGLILLHLSTNPQGITDLNNANVLTLGSVYSGIKEASAALRPKTSNAPPPVEMLNGNGMPPQSEDIPGVTYT